MNWVLFALQAMFLGSLLFSLALSSYIVSGYVRRAFCGDPEARWLGRHITAIALSHLLLLAWTTARFFVAWRTWSWAWIVALLVIFAVSDFGLVQLYLYRRWRDARHARRDSTQSAPPAAPR
jgi:hypothetical protein